MATSTIEGDLFTTCAFVRIHPFSRSMMNPVPATSGANGHMTVARTLTVNRCASLNMLPRSGPVCPTAAIGSKRETPKARTIEHARDMENLELIALVGAPARTIQHSQGKS